MKIVKSCDEVKPKPVVKFKDIPNGTVFRYGAHSAGPYLRISYGAVNGVYDLATNYFFGADSFSGPSIGGSGVDYDFNAKDAGYLPLPNAKLVTGE